MVKNDTFLNLEDIKEIFGSVMSVAGEEIKKAEESVKPRVVFSKAEETASEPARTAEPVREETKKEGFEVEELVKRAREIEQQISAEKSGPSFSGFTDESDVTAMIKLYNEISEELGKTLVAFISEKTVDNMMLRSLEKTAINHVILKNTNWDSEGKLHEKGDVDVERMSKNMKTAGSAAEIQAAEALCSLTQMRLKAVKTGIGPDKYNTAKEAVLSKLKDIRGGFPETSFAFVKDKIIIPAIERGEQQ
jgi:hypothetical protein